MLVDTTARYDRTRYHDGSLSSSYQRPCMLCSGRGEQGELKAYFAQLLNDTDDLTDIPSGELS